MSEMAIYVLASIGCCIALFGAGTLLGATKSIGANLAAVIIASAAMVGVLLITPGIGWEAHKSIFLSEADNE